MLQEQLKKQDEKMKVFWIALIAVQRDYLSGLMLLNCNQIWEIDKMLRLIFEESGSCFGVTTRIKIVIADQ